jgi:hypothetical protein
MKKNFFVFLVSFSFLSLVSCDESTEQEDKSTVFYRSPCPPGEELVVSVDFVWHIFAKSDGLDCKKGLGFCFKAGPVVKFDCVKIQPKELTLASRVSYNNETKSGKSIGFKDEEKKTYTFYFDKRVLETDYFQLEDFNYFSISKDLYLDEEKTIKLVEGEYPRQDEGNYIKYEIPYVN